MALDVVDFNEVLKAALPNYTFDPPADGWTLDGWIAGMAHRKRRPRRRDIERSAERWEASRCAGSLTRAQSQAIGIIRLRFDVPVRSEHPGYILDLEVSS